MKFYHKISKATLLRAVFCISIWIKTTDDLDLELTYHYQRPKFGKMIDGKSVLDPPEAVVGMTKWQPDLFRQRVSVPCLDNIQVESITLFSHMFT